MTQQNLKRFHHRYWVYEHPEEHTRSEKGYLSQRTLIKSCELNKNLWNNEYKYKLWDNLMEIIFVNYNNLWNYRKLKLQHSFDSSETGIKGISSIKNVI